MWIGVHWLGWKINGNDNGGLILLKLGHRQTPFHAAP
jgi:hypothetical protein